MKLKLVTLPLALGIACHLAAQTSQAPLFVIPTSANAAGAFGSFYKTDLTLGNPGTAALDVAITYLPDGKDNTSAPSKTVTVAAGSSLRLADVVGFFGTSGSGAILLQSSPATGSKPFSATSRTYNTVTAQTCASIAGATFGVAVPALESLFGPGAVGVVTDVRNDVTPAGFRTNLGVTNASPVTAVCSARVVAAGAPAFDIPFTVPPWGKQQQSIATVFASGMATFTCSTTDPALRWIGWSTAIDDATSDGSFTLMQVAPQ